MLLVGHSLGGHRGRVDARPRVGLRRHPRRHRRRTAGRGIHGYPAGTHVLSLENRGDLVPLLDGRDNADTTQQVTVQFDDHETSMIGNHGLQHYLHGAAAADASDDPSVREQLDSLRTAGFLGSADRATGRVFQISR